MLLLDLQCADVFPARRVQVVKTSASACNNCPQDAASKQSNILWESMKHEATITSLIPLQPLAFGTEAV